MTVNLTPKKNLVGLYDLLQSRGIEDVEGYLHPTRVELTDPDWLEHIDEGAQLLYTTIRKPDSTILLIVDCDVDGFTSSAIIYQYIKCVNSNQNICFFLHEHKQHGLEDHIESILNDAIHYDLMILPDSSSNDYEYHEQLRQVQTPCLVLDHHDIDPGQLISSNACIINNQTSPLYPNKDLTGAGVTWQFCRYFDRKFGYDYSGDFIDLAALGICGDMGSILSLENRYIMYAGFNHISNYFFEKAIEKQSFSMNNVVTPMSVAFYIVPMMNAMIRVGTMEEKQRLFRALINGHEKIPCNKRGAKGTLEEAAVESLRECTNARSRQNRIVDEMMERLEIKIQKYDLLINKILFVRLNDDDDYPSEIVGLCAMKLAAKYKKPTIIARINEDGIDKGSIRNVDSCALYDFKDFLNKSGYFEWVQGHPNAAGCAIVDTKLKDFHTYANEALGYINFNENFYDVDFWREGDDDIEPLIYNLASINDIWGQGNPEPLIYVHHLFITSDEWAAIGAKKDTLRIEHNGVTFIKFHAEDEIEQIRKCNMIKLNLVGKANINVWAGKETAQLIIEACEIIDDLLEF